MDAKCERLCQAHHKEQFAQGFFSYDKTISSPTNFVFFWDLDFEVCTRFLLFEMALGTGLQTTSTEAEDVDGRGPIYSIDLGIKTTC